MYIDVDLSLAPSEILNLSFESSALCSSTALPTNDRQVDPDSSRNSATLIARMHKRRCIRTCIHTCKHTSTRKNKQESLAEPPRILEGDLSFQEPSQL